MKKIQITLDDALMERIKEAVKQKRTTLPMFIKASIIDYLSKSNSSKIKVLEKRHREGYLKYPVQKGEFDVWENEQVWGS